MGPRLPVWGASVSVGGRVGTGVRVGGSIGGRCRVGTEIGVELGIAGVRLAQTVARTACRSARAICVGFGVVVALGTFRVRSIAGTRTGAGTGTEIEARGAGAGVGARTSVGAGVASPFTLAIPTSAPSLAVAEMSKAAVGIGVEAVVSVGWSVFIGDCAPHATLSTVITEARMKNKAGILTKAGPPAARM